MYLSRDLYARPVLGSPEFAGIAQSEVVVPIQFGLRDEISGEKPVSQLLSAVPMGLGLTTRFHKYRDVSTPEGVSVKPSHIKKHAEAGYSFTAGDLMPRLCYNGFLGLISISNKAGDKAIRGRQTHGLRSCDPEMVGRTYAL